MSGATSSAADGSRTEFKNKDDSRVRNTGHSQAQCSPVPPSSVGTQIIIHGNGTNVGTVISLQCPAKHRLVGKALTCIMGTNSTQWKGHMHCQPAALSLSMDYGFRVAVLASIVSSGIILLLSVAFITCCLLDCVKEDKRKRPERESDALRWEEQLEDSRAHHSHKGRNNNNNNKAQEKLLPLWDTADPVPCDDVRPCRCLQHQAHRPPPSLLPGLDLSRPLTPRNLDSCPPEYPGPPLSTCRTASSCLVHVSAAGTGLLWSYGGQGGGSSEQNAPIPDESREMRNINSNKEISIRIITV